MDPYIEASAPREEFARKWRGLASAGVHQLAIDLPRRGEHPLPLPKFDAAPYSGAVARAEDENVGLWPIALRDRLPADARRHRHPDDQVARDAGAADEVTTDSWPARRPL